MKNFLDFIFESYLLKTLSRSGGLILNSDLGSIAEHSFFVAIIGMTLALKEKADMQKTVLMCVIHDLPETRTGDLNFIHKKYVIALEEEAIQDQLNSLGESKEMLHDIFSEYKEQKTIEAKLVRDADILEQMLCEKMALENGNSQAAGWMEYSLLQLRTKVGKATAEQILKKNSFDWWQDLHHKKAATARLK